MLEKMRSAWNNLSPREQILLAVLGGGFVVSLFVFGLIMPFTQMSDSAEERVANAQRQMQVMQRLTREHNEIEGPRFHCVPA